MSKPVCPECKGPIRFYRHSVEFGSGRRLLREWCAECRNVRNCRVARSGTTGHADKDTNKQKDAAADFIINAMAANIDKPET